MTNFTDRDYLKNFFKAHNIRPKDYLGQNFLVDREVLDKIIEVAQLKRSDAVLEIGPGLGSLTRELTQRVGKVIAVEKDQRLATLLIRNSGLPNVTIINQDILNFNIKQYISGPYKVIANIPYYLTSKLIQNFLTADHKSTMLVLMVQKEVGERIIASPGELSVLGISVQFFADAEIVAEVFKESFWPKPEVDSVIIRIVPKNKFPEVEDIKLFFRIVKLAFAGKRKQIKNTLGNIEALKQAQIDVKARPQDLSLEDWVRLYKSLKV